MEERLYEIIAAYLSGEQLTDEERDFLHKWLAVTENRKVYATFQRIYDNGMALRGSSAVSREDVWQSVARKCELAERNRRRFIRRIWGVAASLALLLGVGLVFLLNREKEKLVAENAAVPASVVQLKLGNGESVALNMGMKLGVISDGEKKIICDSNRLDYRSDKKVGEVTYNTLIVPEGAEYTLILCDGSRVHLNAATELRYPTVFTGGKREVYLSGEAYFEVEKDAEAPFIVRTDRMNIEVLGTSFNVNAYHDMDVYAATLTSGKIRAICGGNEYDMQPGHQIRNNLRTGTVEVVKVDTNLYTSWKDGYYYFEACRLEDIMQTLSRWYGIHAFFQNSGLKEIEFTGRLKRYEDVSQLFKKFEHTRNVRFRLQGNTVVISEK